MPPTPDFLVNLASDSGTGIDTDSDPTTLTLSEAIFQANTAGGGRIILQTDVMVTGVMKRLLDSDIEILGDDPDTAGTIETHSISGGDNFRPLFVKSGTINLSNLTLTNGKAKGGNSLSGGGGAGMGGALFIYSGDVTAENVTFSGNGAIGGDGRTTGLSYGGGGLFGDAGGGGGGGVFGNSATGVTGGYGGYGSYSGG
ncbi:MAG: hypothetical protein HC795_17265, partial [Coleofasciculaceae cyanobacterium RL_1_1]|nr:hypothetical protein [Coleofasciculaceae cyanobacterium RL_1_1]